MIELHSWPTPNGQKVHIALEELGLPYEPHPVNIGAGEQFSPDFLALNHNHRIPVIVDTDGPGGRFALFESGAILIYLAEKAGRLLPSDPAARYRALAWLMFQMGGVGPMFGQVNHFTVYAPEKIPYAVDRYTNEAKRLVRVLGKRLAEAEYLAGDDYSIADVATYPWIANIIERGIGLDESPGVARWFAAVGARPGVERGMALMKERRQSGPISDATRELLFGKGQHATR